MTAPAVTTARPPIVYLYLAIVVVTWAGNWPLMKLALADAPPLLFVLLRMTGTLALLAPTLLVMRQPLLPRRDLCAARTKLRARHLRVALI